MHLKQFITTDFVYFEGYLQQSLENITHNRLKQAMTYSLSNGGKRVRPLLLLATLKALGHPLEIGYASAVALEYIHTYSLIHDDLPAMDNDDFRRGKLTNHKKFDEATAILAGDALQTKAFEHICQTPANASIIVELVQALANVSGANGMIGGQMEDIQAEKQTIPLEKLIEIHQKKTGQLFLFAIHAALLLADEIDSVKKVLYQFAGSFGLAFQIHNDIKDEKQDEKLQKSTYVSLLGREKAQQRLEEEIQKAERCLLEVKVLIPTFDVELLLDFLQYVK